MSILLATGFIDELSAEKSVGRSANEFGSATKGKICGDKLCSETGGKIIMPWDGAINETDQQNCSISSDQETCNELNFTDLQEEIPNETNPDEDELKNNLGVKVIPLGSSLFTEVNIPVTIPLHQGFYMGKLVYYIITDSSDPTHADVISKNQGWNVNVAQLLVNATEEALSKTYMFTNGVPGDGVYGFQGEIFTSTPEQTDAYSALTSHVNVTWNRGQIPIILDSEKEMLIAEKRGFIELANLNVVLNMPQIVWPDGQMAVKANKTLTHETPFVGGQILDVDLKNKTTTFIAHRGLDYEGKTIFFIVTDATPVGPAVSLGVSDAPKNAALISNPAAVDSFQFMNGIEGSGPFGFQLGISSGSIDDEATYSPMSRIYVITWNDPDSATLIQTRSTIDEFENDELITVDLARPMATDHIVHPPIVDPFQVQSTDQE